MSDFIQLNRTFRKLDTGKDQTDEAYKISLAFGHKKAKLWADIVENPRVVILAEAGAGKTEEFEHATQSLLNDGKMAFFLRLEHLSSDLKTAFEIGTFTDYESWKAGNEIGYFFLDSVDEAKLVDPLQFERAIRLFAAEIENNNFPRIRVFISSRVTRWQPKSDLEFVQRHLPFYEEDREKSDDSDKLGDIFDETDDELKVETIKKPTPIILGTPLVLGMQGLNDKQMKTYSLAKGLPEPDAVKMIAEIYSLEVQDLASRPKDLDDILEFWKTDRKVGTRLDLIERSFTNRVSEHDPKRKEKDPLTFAQAQEGARKLAAAVTLQQVNRILVPGADPVTQGVDAEQILADWSQQEIQALLQRPLFEEQTYGTVRFYHRSVREFLTAEWLNKLLKNDKSRRDIEAVFFRKQYGLDVVVPTSRPVLSWMVLLDDSIKEKTKRISPEVFIKSGDVSRLPLSDRQGLLTQLCDILATSGFGRTYFTHTELYRFGKADMVDHIHSLVDKYSDNDEVLNVLFVMAEQRNIDVGYAVAVSIVKDKSRTSYTRTNALEYLLSRSSSTPLEDIAAYVLADDTYTEHTVLAWLIEFHVEVKITPTQIVILLSRFKAKRLYKYDRAYSAPHRAIDNFTSDQCFEFLDLLYPLLKTEPLLEKKYLDISEHYKWLYTPSLKALEMLINDRDERIFDTRFLELLSYSVRSHDYVDRDDYDTDLSKLVPQFQALNDALFWFSIETVRTPEKSVKHYRNGHFWRRNWVLGNNDFDRIIEWIECRDLEDDKLVSLSLAFDIYRDNNRGAKRRGRLWKAVTGNPVLENQLRTYLNPPAQSKADRNYKQEEIRWAKKQKIRKALEEKNLKDWQGYLASDKADQELDVSTASEGGMWQGNNYLMNQTRRQTNGSDKWASKEWETLIPVYGRRAAGRYRDAAIAYWRCYVPKDTTNATIFGLTGLAIEAEENPDWLKNLTVDEAKLAMTYAKYEMNGFPDWLEGMFKKYPDVVLNDICTDISHEFRERKENEQSFGTLHKITWRYPWLYCALASFLIECFKKNHPKHYETLLNSIGIILKCRETKKSDILGLANEGIERSAGNLHRQALWHAVWMNVSGVDGLEAVISFTETLKEEDKTQFVMSWITTLLGRSYDNLPSHFTDYQTVGVLKDMFIFAYQHIRSAEDLDRAGKGVYSPTLRDNAQSARNTIFNLLSDIPGRLTYEAFLELSARHPDEDSRPWYLHHARSRAEKDADSMAWKSEDFAEFEKSAKRRPQNHQEVFDLSRSRLLDIKYDLEHGDYSQAIAMIEIDQETTHRNYFAKEFSEKSNGFYSVTAEDELADKKRVDLRIHGSGLDCPVPIELKLAGNWGGDSLFERLENQLIGDYLRDMKSSRGIFLIVNRGKKKRWDTKDGRRRNFEKVILALQERAEVLVRTLPHIEEVQVIGIDLTLRKKTKKK